MVTSRMQCNAVRFQRTAAHVIRLGNLLQCALATIGLALTGCSREVNGPPESLPDLPTLSAIRSGQVLPSVQARIDALYSRLSENPTDPTSNGELGMLLHAHQLLETARPLYLRAHALDSDSFRWIYYLGVVEAALGRSEDATAWFQQALALDPQYVPAELATARGLLEKGDLEASEEMYRRVLGRFPDTARARLGLGRVLAARGEAGEAVNEYERACTLSPDYAEARYALAMALRELNRHQEAQHHLALYQQDPARRPPLEDPLLERVHQQEAGADAYIRAGVESVNAGEPEYGAKLLERAVFLNPSDEGASLSLLIAYGRMGDHGRAADHFGKAIRLFPTSEDLQFNYATILAQRGELAEASKWFARVLEINPQHADGHASMGYLFETSGDMASAVGHYRSALDHDPGNPTARFRLGRIALAQGKAEEAVDHFRAALGKSQEQEDQLLYGIATASAMRGDFAEALRFARQAHATALALGHTALAEAIQADLASFTQEAAARQ